MTGQTAAAVAAALAVLFCLAAPGFSQPAEAQTAEEPAASTAGMSVPEALEDETFHYDPAGRRDPFKSLLSLQSKKKDLSLLPPIQQIDLGQVKITGVVLDEIEGPRAMIKAPNGQTFVVKKGTIVGRNEGEIIEVTLQGIRVVEKYVDFVGRETLKEVYVKTKSAEKQQR